MNSYLIILKGLFRNKLRFKDGTSKNKKIGLLLLFGFIYAAVMAGVLSIMTALKELFVLMPQLSVMSYFFLLLTGAAFVLVFGIFALVNMLYLSKDTDFYSTLPVKQSTVFAAKMSFVYITEAVVTAAIILPLLITLGALTHAWAWYYVITVLTVLIVPSLPLVLAAIIAIPVMLLASKLKHRSVVALVMYIVLFCGFFTAYSYFVFSASETTEITEDMMQAAMDSLNTVMYVFYPYTVLSLSAYGVKAYGLSAGASSLVNLLIFLGISIALVAIMILASKAMYARSVTANNQTYNNEKAKKGTFKTSGSTAALIKREFKSAMRTTQVAFQCFAVALLPVIFSIGLSFSMKNSFGAAAEAGMTIDDRFGLMIVFTVLIAMFATLGNGAATSFSREGGAMASLKILPVDGKKVVRAKTLSWLFIAIPSALVSVVTANVFNFRVDCFLLSLFSLVPLAAEYVLFGALWDLLSPKLKWTDPMQAIKHNGHVLAGQAFGLVSGLAFMILFMVLFFNGVDFDTIGIVIWALIYALVGIFAVIDVILYKKANEYYNRIEI